MRRIDYQNTFSSIKYENKYKTEKNDDFNFQFWREKWSVVYCLSVVKLQLDIKIF